MPARRSLAEILGDADPAEDAPVAKWGWRECGCGAVFLAPEGRAKCVVCRTGFEVVRVGRGVSEDEPEEGDGEMAQALGIDEARVQQMIADGVPAARACREFRVTAIQFASWCYRKRVNYPGVPMPNTSGVATLQDEIDELSRPRRIVSATAALKAQIEAQVSTAPAPEPEIPAPTPGPSVADVVALHAAAVAPDPTPEEAPAPEQPAAPTLPADIPAAAEPVTIVPFRRPVREGGVIFGVRVEGSRIIVGDILVEGDITDFEAEVVLRWIRDKLMERKGAEIVAEAAS